MIENLSNIEDDGLLTPEVGEWSEDKYKVVSYYASMVGTSMKKIWKARIYLDLFAGSGRARIKGTNRIVITSPMLALNIQHKFDQYIFCDADKQLLDALKERIRREAISDVQINFFLGDVNKKIDAINKTLISNSLLFCFIDPFSSENFKFSTIQELSPKSRAIDFLVLIPSFMDVHRNLDIYIEENHKRIEEFIGNKNWRDEWKKNPSQNFGLFFLSMFSKRMSELSFLTGEPKPIYQKGKRLLYHLAFYSRHSRGIDFWNKAKHYSTDQLELL